MGKIVVDTFGTRLREFRERKNLTQKDLADLIGKDEAVISKWERDKNLPQKANIARLAEVLDVSREWLLTGMFSYSTPRPDPNESSSRMVSIPFYTPAWDLADQFAKTGGLTFTEEAHARVAILAASLAIQAGREPNKEDVLAAISLSLSK